MDVVIDEVEMAKVIAKKEGIDIDIVFRVLEAEMRYMAKLGLVEMED